MTHEALLAVEHEVSSPLQPQPPPGLFNKVAAAKAQRLDGLLAVHKPTGMISKDVSRWLVRRLGRLKIGHVGTLDPGAAGVLPILLGRATRLQDFLLELPKTYEFDIAFGSETDTLDRDGTVVRELPWQHVTAEAIATSMREFMGQIDQLPPLYSAVKFKGRPLYDYARAGAAGDIPPLAEMKRRVTILDFVMHGYDGAAGLASFTVTCSKGTYVRSLVKDLAEKVGTCGTLARLVRTQAAGIGLDRAYSLDEIEDRLAGLDAMVQPMADVDLGMPRWKAQRRPDIQRLRSGQPIVLDNEDYLAGLTAGPGVDASLTAWSRQLVLLGEAGLALGIGTVRRNDAGRVVLTMKRGL